MLAAVVEVAAEVDAACVAAREVEVVADVDICAVVLNETETRATDASRVEALFVVSAAASDSPAQRFRKM